MTLKTKFIVVLCLFGLAVCINIAAAVYYTDFQLRRAGKTFESVFRPASLVRYLLASLRQQHDIVLACMDRGQFDPADRERLSSLSSVMLSDRSRLSDELAGLGLGPEFTRLEKELDAYEAILAQYVESGTPPDAVQHRLTYIASYGSLRDVLEDMIRALSSAEQGYVQGAPRTGSNLYLVLFGMAMLEIVALIITLELFRKWMLKPIEGIRAATEEIAAGNLNYRLPDTQSDEFGALAHEVNNMAAALVVAQRELKQKERLAATGEMVAVVAHNIRNPLAGIRATAQTCLHEVQPDSDQGRHQLRIIGAVDSLEQWLKELLHLNRPLELRLEPTAIDELVEDLRQTFQPSTERKQLELLYEPFRPAHRVGVDRQYFIQALASILDNAIQAAPHGSRVRISTGRTAAPAEKFFIEVSDSGEGIPEAIRQEIFQPYFSTKPGGTGIGLSMAKRIIEAHHGSLSVTNGSSAGQGRTGAILRIEIPDLPVRRRGVDQHG